VNISNNKTKISTIALILTLTISAIIVALPITNAADPPKTWTTVSFISVSPNPVGVNQEVLVVFWMDKAHPLALGFERGKFTGFTVEVTKPDNTKDILGPFDGDPISAAYTMYTPKTVGTYEMVFKFPEQVILDVPEPPTGWGSFNKPEQVGDIYAASTSNIATLEVTEEPVQPWTESPLPTNYWERPINALNREWACIAGDWLGGAANADKVNLYSEGPETPHVLWTRQLWLGGLGGENAGSSSYLSTTASSGRNSPVIINGIVFLEDRATAGTNWGYSAVDLYTGETLWYSTENIFDSRNDFGSVYNFRSGSVIGTWAYLWKISGSTWIAKDPFTGNVVFTIENAQSAGYAVYGEPRGDILRYNIVGSGADKRLTVWNTTKVMTPINTREEPMRPYQLGGRTFDGLTGFSLNVSIPDVQGSILDVVPGKYVIGGVAGKHNNTHVEPGHIWTLDLTKGNEGALISNVTFTPPQQTMDETEYYRYTASYLSETRMKGPYLFS
jgi:hypothetical protein